MAIQTISYNDKSYLNQNADIPNVNKVTDNDMNEIKSVVNNNANEYSTFMGLLNDYIVAEGGDISSNYYIKYNSGVMIQYGRVAVTVSVNTAMGSVFRSANTIQHNLAENFYDTNYIINLTANPALNSAYIGAKSTDNFTIWAIAYASTSAASRYIDFIAIGRWKQ